MSQRHYLAGPNPQNLRKFYVQEGDTVVDLPPDASVDVVRAALKKLGTMPAEEVAFVCNPQGQKVGVIFLRTAKEYVAWLAQTAGTRSRPA